MDIRVLANRYGKNLDRPLTFSEKAIIEARYGFQFPAAYCELLSQGVPAGEGFPNWLCPDAKLEEQLAWPIDGLLFDVEENGFWCSSWGARPDDPGARLAMARQSLAKAPRLCPIFGHRYMPCVPGVLGSIVLSVYQSDVIIYADSLEKWFEAEFGTNQPVVDSTAVDLVFWGDIISANS